MVKAGGVTATTALINFDGIPDAATDEVYACGTWKVLLSKEQDSGLRIPNLRRG